MPKTSFLRARFTEPAEYVDELRQDLELVERRIVRVTKSARLAGPNGVLTRVSVLAGAIVDGHPVVLERYVGDLWGQPTADAEVQAKASEVVDELERGLRELGLEVRGGILEEDGSA